MVAANRWREEGIRTQDARDILALKTQLQETPLLRWMSAGYLPCAYSERRVRLDREEGLGSTPSMQWSDGVIAAGGFLAWSLTGELATNASSVDIR